MNTALSSPHPFFCPPCSLPSSGGKQSTQAGRKSTQTKTALRSQPFLTAAQAFWATTSSQQVQLKSTCFRGRIPPPQKTPRCLFLEYAAGGERLLRIKEYDSLNVTPQFECAPPPTPCNSKLMCLKFGPQLMALSWEGKSFTG